MPRSPRSCWFIATSWNAGAVSGQFLGIARSLAARGHRVVVLTDRGALAARDQWADLDVQIWPSPRPTRPADAMFLARLMREHRPAGLVTNFGASNLMLMVGAAARVPVRVQWYHTLYAQNASDSRMPAWQFRLLHLRKALVYRLATHIVANSEAARRDVIAHFRVPRDVTSVTLNTLADPLPQIAPGIVRDPDKLVCVGRLSPSKGQRTLLEALALVHRTSAWLELVGDGPERAALEQLATRLGIRARCQFAGARSHAESLAAVAGAAISVVPSLDEAFGLVNLEALALATPLITAATGGSVEIARDEREALHFPPGDGPALARQLDRMFDDATLRQRLARDGRARFLDVFEQGRGVVRIADWLESLIR